MGHGTRQVPLGHAVRTFTPDDTSTTLYIVGDGTLSLHDLVERVMDLWPDVMFEDVSITTQHIQTDCLGQEMYDSSNYTTYIVVTRNNE